MFLASRIRIRHLYGSGSFHQQVKKKQCSGSVPFCYGSGSSDPYHFVTDPDPPIRTSVLFVSDLPDATQMFFCFLLFEGTFTSFFTDKKP